MDIKLDLRVVQLLGSRLCHDLVGGVGAINNGLELVREFDNDMEGEAMELVSSSARQVAERLQFFRVAFGLAAGAVRTGGDVMKLLTPSVIGWKNSIAWPKLDASAPLVVGDNGTKVLLNMAMLAGETLPRGGEITLSVSSAKDGGQIRIQATGTGVHIDPDIAAAAAGKAAIGDLTPRSAQAFYAGRLAEGLGGTLVMEAGGGEKAVLRAERISPET